jgi:hypothetical protein
MKPYRECTIEISSPIDKDIEVFKILRTTISEEATITEYLDRRGEWVEYVGFETLLNPPARTGSAKRNGLPAEWKGNLDT